MYGRAYSTAICLSQKLGRDTQSERKGMNVLCNEEEHRESETRQRHTRGDKCWHPERGGLQQRGDEPLKVNHLYRTVLPGLDLPLVDYFVSLFTSDQFVDLPQDARVTFF